MRSASPAGAGTGARASARASPTQTTRAYFLFDALPVFSDAELAAAMDDLAALLRAGWPDANLSATVIGP